MHNRLRWMLFNILMRLPEWLITPERIEAHFSDLANDV
jgi:hypothetical protein